MLKTMFALTSILALCAAGCAVSAEETNMGDERVATAEQAFGSEYWIYARPFTGTPVLLLPGCEVVQNAQILEDFGDGTPTKVMGVTASKYATPSVYSWDRDVRYDLDQEEQQNSLTWSVGIAACMTGALVTPSGNVAWYLANYGQ